MERVFSKAEPKPFGPSFSRTLISSVCTELLFPPHFGSPQVTTWPSIKIAAKALSVPVTFTTCFNCSFTPVPRYNFRVFVTQICQWPWRISCFFCWSHDEVPNGSKTWSPIPWGSWFTSSTFIIFHLFVFGDLLKTQQQTNVHWKPKAIISYKLDETVKATLAWQHLFNF